MKTARPEYMQILTRIAEKARRLDSFMLKAGTSKAAQKTAGALLDESEGMEKAVKAALDVEDSLDSLLALLIKNEHTKPN